MMRIWLVSSKVFLLFLFSLASCADTCKDVVKTVKLYNKALSEAYRMRDVSPLKDFAGQRELKKIMVLIDLKNSNNVVLESEMYYFKTLSCEVQEDTAKVKTIERWRYYDRPLQPMPFKPKEINAEMQIEYILKKDSRWKVLEVKGLSHKEL